MSKIITLDNLSRFKYNLLGPNYEFTWEQLTVDYSLGDNQDEIIEDVIEKQYDGIHIKVDDFMGGTGFNVDLWFKKSVFVPSVDEETGNLQETLIYTIVGVEDIQGYFAVIRTTDSVTGESNYEFGFEVAGGDDENQYPVITDIGSFYDTSITNIKSLTTTAFEDVLNADMLTFQAEIELSYLGYFGQDNNQRLWDKSVYKLYKCNDVEFQLIGGSEQTTTCKGLHYKGSGCFILNNQLHNYDVVAYIDIDHPIDNGDGTYSYSVNIIITYPNIGGNQ